MTNIDEIVRLWNGKYDQLSLLGDKLSEERKAQLALVLDILDALDRALRAACVVHEQRLRVPAHRA